VGRHKDPGALTNLYQDDVGELDIRRRSGGEWARVKFVPGSFIINVGSFLRPRGAPRSGAGLLLQRRRRRGGRHGRVRKRRFRGV